MLDLEIIYLSWLGERTYKFCDPDSEKCAELAVIW